MNPRFGLHSRQCIAAFQLPQIFGGQQIGKQISTKEDQKRELLDAISGTGNGKTATQEQQAEVLRIVRTLETKYPPSSTFLKAPTSNEKELLDGAWYLKYTSPSALDDADQFPNEWKPQYASEGASNVETKQFNAKGTISASGVKVDISDDRRARQCFHLDRNVVVNDVDLGWGYGIAGGTYRPSTTVDNRVVASFNTAKIYVGGKPTVKPPSLSKDDENPGGLTIDLSFIFQIFGLLRGSKDTGWLEVTFIDETLRIGRGNKGTMFVLTREP